MLLGQPTGANTLAGVVESAVYLGFQIDARVRLDTGDMLSCQVPNSAAVDARRWRWAARSTRAFARSTA